MKIELEYEAKKYVEFEGETITYLLGSDHSTKWKVYRGLKRFSKGKMLSELEENVYGDDGIVIRCDEKQMKAKDLPLLFLDCRESFLEQYRNVKGSLMQDMVDSLASEYNLVRQLDCVNDELLKVELVLQEYFDTLLDHVKPAIRGMNYNDITKNFLALSFFEDEVAFPVEMMDITKLIDDYCTLLEQQLERYQKKTWLWISNPNSFIENNSFIILLEKLKKIAIRTNLLHIFIMSDDYLKINYCKSDISETILLYSEHGGYQQLPDFETMISSIQRYYPCELVSDSNRIVESLFRIFPYVGKQNTDNGIYLKPKDMVLLKVVNQLLDCNCVLKCADLEQNLSEYELKFLIN